MSTPIKAGMLTEVSNFIKNISDTLFKAIDKLVELGIVTDVQKNDEGDVICHMVIDGEPAEMITSNAEDKNYSDVTIKPKHGREVELKRIDNRKFFDTVLSEVRKIYPNADIVQSSKSLRVRLQKIVSSSDINVNLTAIHANYDPTLALNDLDTVLNSNELLSELSEEPECFEIVDNGDEYDISTVDEFSTSGACEAIIGAAMKIWCNLSVIHWAAKGNNFTDLHSALDSFRYMLISEIDFFGELSIELNDRVVNPGIYTPADDIPPIMNDDGEGFTAEFGFELTSRMIEDYIRILDTYYVNFTHDVQSYLDEEIRMWRKNVNYFIKQRLK